MVTSIPTKHRGTRGVRGLLLASAILLPTLASGGSPVDQPVLAKATVEPVKTGSIHGVFDSRARVKTKGETSQRDVVIYLVESPKKEYKAPSAPAVVVQEKLNFAPHVLPIMKGTTVKFQNLDAVEHNVYSSDSCCSVDSNMGAGNESEVTYSEAGIASIICRLHPDMSLWVLILDNPWFTHVELTKEKGEDGSRYFSQYEIPDVPPGTYELTFWNKKLKAETYEVVVEEGKATKFDIKIAK